MKPTLSPRGPLARIGSALALAVLTAIGTITSASAAPPEGQRPAQEEAPGHIVVFKKNVNAKAAAKALESQQGLRIGRVYQHAIRGAFVSTDLPPQALTALQKNPNVAYVEKNGVVSLAAQPIPTGIDRVDAECAVTINGNGGLLDVDIAVIDTGISPDHPDLNVNHAMSVGFEAAYEGRGKKKQRLVVTELHDVSAWADYHGHGTHVSGTAAAIDNEIGVVGVAPGARVTAVRVLNPGSSNSALTLAGMDYVAAHADVFEVANISLQYGLSQAMNDAVANMTAAGVVVVVCAGNWSRDAYDVSPASAPSAITVSALTDTDGLPGGFGPDSLRSDGTLRGADDSLATFTNFGAVIDVAAPGVDIYSTYLDGGYTFMSGTSMASPHVAGAVALHIAHNGRDRDGDGVIDGNDVALMESLIKSTGWQFGEFEYFEGDPDAYPEPLLNLPALLSHDIDCFPGVALTSPADGAVVSGIVSLLADASDDHAVSQVEFFVEGVSIGVDSDPSDGYATSWNSTYVADETYEISVVATDDALQSSSASILVSVDNIDSAPVADAGPDQTVEDSDGNGSELVTLDGSGSSDDRGISTYAWYAGPTLLATGMSPTIEFPVGIHTIDLFVSDSGGQSAQDSVVITVEEAPPAGTQASVASITFSPYGGKNGNNHLQVAASIQNDLGAAVGNAVVEADLYRGTTRIASSTSTTDGSGVAVLFDEKSIAAGCYEVVILNVTAPGMTFDGATPSNKYCK